MFTPTPDPLTNDHRRRRDLVLTLDPLSSLSPGPCFHLFRASPQHMPAQPFAIARIEVTHLMSPSHLHDLRPRSVPGPIQNDSYPGLPIISRVVSPTRGRFLIADYLRLPVRYQPGDRSRVPFKAWGRQYARRPGIYVRDSECTCSVHGRVQVNEQASSGVGAHRGLSRKETVDEDNSGCR
jgi:hypothetical protein